MEKGAVPLRSNVLYCRFFGGPPLGTIRQMHTRLKRMHVGALIMAAVKRLVSAARIAWLLQGHRLFFGRCRRCVVSRSLRGAQRCRFLHPGSRVPNAVAMPLSLMPLNGVLVGALRKRWRIGPGGSAALRSVRFRVSKTLCGPLRVTVERVLPATLHLPSAQFE